MRRAILSVVFGVTPERVGKTPTYTCVLGVSEIGREILKIAKKQAEIDIITKPVKALEAREETAESFSFAKSVEDVIALSAPTPIPSDTGKSPYIKR